MTGTLRFDRVSAVPRRGLITLHDVSFAADPRAVTGLAGRGRQGQHEALRAVSGLTDLFSGSVLLSDVRIDRLRPAERPVAMVFANHALRPSLTVAGALAGSGAAAEVERCLRAAGLTDLADRAVRELAAADRFMLHVAAKLTERPDVLLFEDAFLPYGRDTRKEIIRRLRRLNWRSDCLLLAADSDPDIIRSLADDIVLFDGGRVVPWTG